MKENSTIKKFFMFQYFTASLSKFQSFSKFIELSGFGKGNRELGVDASWVFSFEACRSNSSCGCKSVLLEDLWKFGNEWYGFSHAFNLDVTMLFEYQFAQEKPLVKSGLSSDSINIGFVELRTLSSHVEFTQNIWI